MNRLPDWPERLKETIARYESAPWKWGETDCAMFAADCVLAVTGADVAGTFRGSYENRIGSEARLRYRGYKRLRQAAHDALTKIGATEIAPRFAQVGDIGITGADVLAVRMAHGFVARRPDGSFGEAVAVSAWAVGWA